MADTLALTDNQRVLIGMVFSALLAVNVSMAGLAASNSVVIPSYAYFVVGLAAIIVYAVKDKLGVATSSTSNTAVNVVPDQPELNTRKVELPKKK